MSYLYGKVKQGYGICLLTCTKIVRFSESPFIEFQSRASNMYNGHGAQATVDKLALEYEGFRALAEPNYGLPEWSGETRKINDQAWSRYYNSRSVRQFMH